MVEAEVAAGVAAAAVSSSRRAAVSSDIVWALELAVSQSIPFVQRSASLSSCRSRPVAPAAAAGAGVAGAGVAAGKDFR